MSKQCSVRLRFSFYTKGSVLEAGAVPIQLCCARVKDYMLKYSDRPNRRKQAAGRTSEKFLVSAPRPWAQVPVSPAPCFASHCHHGFAPRKLRQTVQSLKHTLQSGRKDAAIFICLLIPEEFVFWSQIWPERADSSAPVISVSGQVVIGAIRSDFLRLLLKMHSISFCIQ